jgi:pimeloyl-ACP methyl ester carboxylesterase
MTATKRRARPTSLDRRVEGVGRRGTSIQSDRLLWLSDGRRLSYRDAGSPTGRPVLYLHGTPSSRMEADRQLSEAAARLGLRVLAPDRPGYGRTSFAPYDVRGYAEHIIGFLDELDVGVVGILGVSGGGRYACACAAHLGPRASRTTLVASTASSDLPGVRATWSTADRRLYALAVRAPWLLRRYLAVVARRIRSDPTRVPELFDDLLTEAAATPDPEVRAILTAAMTEAFRQGPRGAVRDISLEARPWHVDLAAIETPVDVWHGYKDTLVPVEHAAALVSAIPTASLRLFLEEGHISLRRRHIAAILEAFA